MTCHSLLACLAAVDWNTIGVWFSGAATLAAVVIALRLQHLYEIRERPKLSVLFNNSDDCLRYIVSDRPSIIESELAEPKSEELWIRVVVTSRGETAARDVQLQLIDVYRDDDPAPESRSRLGFKASNLNATSIGLVPSGLPREFDIAFVWHKQFSDEFQARLVTSRPEILSWEDLKASLERDSKGKGLEIGHKYRIRFAVFGSNADAVRYDFELTLGARRTFDPDPPGMQGKDALKARISGLLLSVV